MEKMTNRLPEGVGSRGGMWHDPEYRKAYFRRYRATHPDYAERDNRRARRRRQRARQARQEARVSLSLTIVLREMVRQQPGSRRSFARRAGVDHSALTRFVNEDRPTCGSDLIDALIAAFGIWNVARSWAAIKRDVAARQGNTRLALGGSADDESPASQSRS